MTYQIIQIQSGVNIVLHTWYAPDLNEGLRYISRNSFINLSVAWTDPDTVPLR